jgi:hypothetical protein
MIAVISVIARNPRRSDRNTEEVIATILLRSHTTVPNRPLKFQLLSIQFASEAFETGRKMSVIEILQKSTLSNDQQWLLRDGVDP